MAKPEDNNFGNLTPRARQILLLAKQEAERFNHDHIGTEHLLLGILCLNEGVAVNVLKSLGLNLAQLRLEVEKSCGIGGATQTDGPLPLTPRLKRVLMLAATEAQAMNYNFVGTEHLLLAILREGESAAARILQNLNVNLDEVRQAVIKTLDSDYLPENNDDQSEPPNIPPQQQSGQGGT
ncbi:hypothetical protein KH017_17330, partial [bacterium]|nr:hypothetical protein [bacterium]